MIHLATPSAAEVGAGGTALTLSALQGTHRVLQFACQSGAKRLLLASSGAVYGRQPADLSHIPEDYGGAPDPSLPTSAYGEIKRMSELMCALTPDVECVVARGFSFVGPYLPLTDKFAIGSFMRDAIAGGPIRIHGDGTPLRSYLYAADMAIWLLTLLLKGQPSRAYNLGSDTLVSLRELADSVAAPAPGAVQIVIEGDARSGPANAYVPSIQRARAELGLEVRLDLPTSIARSIAWATAAG